MVWIWLGIVIGLSLIEVTTTNLVTIWFVASGIVSMILSLFVDNYFIQFSVFVILGTILLFTTRDYLVKLMGDKNEKTNLDRVVGMTAIVTEEIKKNHPGEVNRLTNDEKDELIRVIDLCDGIVMPGTYKLYEYDNFIYKYSLNKDIPILGICGGMQLMGIVASEGVDTKDILVKNETKLNHFKKGIEYVHNIKIEENTLLNKILGKREIKINSRHNFHLVKTNNLKVCAYSEDKLIEAVEVPNKKFVLGLQWHPESMIEYDEFANKIFDAFINACKN